MRTFTVASLGKKRKNQGLPRSPRRARARDGEQRHAALLRQGSSASISCQDRPTQPRAGRHHRAPQAVTALRSRGRIQYVGLSATRGLACGQQRAVPLAVAFERHEAGERHHTGSRTS